MRPLWRGALRREGLASAAPFGAAVLLALAFAAALGGRGAAESRTTMVASAALGPIGAVAPYAPPLASLETLSDVPFRNGVAIDESLRLAFAECDRSDRFRGAPVGEGACADEPNDLAALVRLPSGAVYMEAHLGLDLSGSHAACSGTPSAQCAPFFDFPDAPGAAYDALGERWRELFPASDTTPLISIPMRAPVDGPASNRIAEARAFAEATGLAIGDVGVVVYRDRIVPVMISDGAPRHRALSGSLALFEALGVSRCRRRAPEEPELCADPKPYGLGAPVVVILFPGSALEDPKPETLDARIASEALRRFEKLAQPRG